ncbi:hypothetical protein Y032_0523g2909 [Ancylostoma ceylanicum]|uniref:Uncharacterized protein n=1 Tax=Ancylostoma ceylanicum TaxID=53326 RepID=A0A016WSK5_9BILA|nr:hypothetical protein Y032_0523g2909 [Ancylostoma ceylanicum]
MDVTGSLSAPIRVAWLRPFSLTMIQTSVCALLDVHLMPKNFDSFYKRLCRTRYGNAQRGIFVQNNITEILYRVTYGQVPPQTRKYVTRVSGAGNQKSLKSTRTRKLQIAEMECSSVKCTGYVRIVCPGKCRDDRNNEA